MAKHPGGRPTKLTPDIQSRIVELVKKGNYIETAALAVGIDKATLYRWLKAGGIAKGGIQKEFCDAVTRACAESETLALDKLQLTEDANLDGKLILERMARRFPDRWGPKHRIEAQVEHSGGVTILVKTSDHDPRVMSKIQKAMEKPERKKKNPEINSESVTI